MKFWMNCAIVFLMVIGILTAVGLASTYSREMNVKKLAYQCTVRALMGLGGACNRGSVRRMSKELGLEGVAVEYDCEKDIVFTPEEWEQEVRGDFYKPRVEGRTPVVLLVHGGGWAENDNRYQMVGIAKRLVRAGFAVFSVTYRLAPEFHFPAPVDDLLEALRWLNENEGEMEVDMEKTAVYGYSAGGHLAELLAMREMPAGVRIKAVVAGGTPHFMRLDPDFPLVQDLMGHRWQDDPDRYRDATPVDRVSENFPPVFVYHGAKDGLVPWPHVDKWEERLKKLGVEHEIYWVKGRGHIGTFLMPRGAVCRAVAFLKGKLVG